MATLTYHFKLEDTLPISGTNTMHDEVSDTTIGDTVNDGLVAGATTPPGALGQSCAPGSAGTRCAVDAISRPSTNPLAFNYWFHITDYSTPFYVSSNWRPTTDPIGTNILIASATQVTIKSAGTSGTITLDSAMPTSQWFMFTLTRDSSDEWTVFIDGVEHSNNVTIAQQHQFQYYLNNASYSSNNTDYEVADIRFYSSDLTSGDIATLLAEGASGVERMRPPGRAVGRSPGRAVTNLTS